MKKMCLSNYLRTTLLAVAYIATSCFSWAQEIDSVVITRDTLTPKMNMDAVHNRPLLNINNTPVSIGGYLEANTIYSGEDGVNEGLSFQARRLTLFLSSSIIKRIKFLSELEFEEGGREINVEFAAIDVTFSPALNLRGGVILNPIGAFNQNHDGPKWEFVERPDVAVNMLPATWSNPGFGLYGHIYKKNWVIGYEAYISNGFDNRIISNDANKTFLPAAKENGERFEESNNGRPMVTGKIAIKNQNLGEVGFSYMGGIYNKFQEDGLQLAQKMRLDVFAVDFNTTLSRSGTYIVGEAAWVFVDVPDTYTNQYGERQRGFFVDIVQPIIRRNWFDWEEARVNIAVRIDHVDWNRGKFKGTAENIGDQLWAVTPAISFRPSSQTVFRLNYRFQWQTDLPGNPPARSAAWLLGFSTYF